ncbi:MAG: molybdopterin-binding protein [Solirubrobacterales bacterium]
MSEEIRIGAAASILGVSVDTLRRWGKEGKITFGRTSGGQRTVDPQALRELLMERTAPSDMSARNQLDGTVVSVEKDGIMAKVELACGGYRVVSVVTRVAVEELGLKPGHPATAVVKATSVEIRRS